MTSSKPFIAAWICEELFPVYAWRYCVKKSKQACQIKNSKTQEMLTYYKSHTKLHKYFQRRDPKAMYN